MLRVIACCCLFLAVALGGDLLKIRKADKQALLDAHNKVRQEAKEGMVNLTWSKPAADYAAINAAKCVWGHSEGEDAKGNKFGENIRGKTSDFKTSGEYLIDASEAWAKEKQYVDVDWFCIYGSRFGWTGHTCGHYSAMVWEDTTQVGCAVAVCPKEDYVWKYTYCNYFEEGNRIINGKATHPF